MVSMAGANLWSRLEAADARTYRTLRIIPLKGRSSDEPAYRLFDGKSADKIRISEVSEGGSVPNLRVKNGLDTRVLLIDGQELIGAKQNRTLNTDVLVSAGGDVVIPVSCVEAGRWSYLSRKFSSGTFMYRSARAARSADVAASLRAQVGARADQGEVWDKVGMLLTKLNVASPSAAMHDAYQQREEDLAEIREAFEMPPDTIGVAVYDGQRFLGLDVFDRSRTFAVHWKALLDSYAIDWLAFSETDGDRTEAWNPSIDELLRKLESAPWQRFDAPGEGHDMRWEDESLTASALVWGEDSVVHLQAFPRSDKGTRVRDVAAGTMRDLPARSPPVVPRPSSVSRRHGERPGTRCTECGFLYGVVKSPEGDYCNHCGHGQS